VTAYLDHNATTPLDKRVLDAMLPYLTDQYGNPSAVYRRGRVVRQAIETAREQVAQLVGAHASQVIFTSGGTEANNLALKGLPGVRSVAVSAVEHASVLEPARQLRQRYEVWEIPVDPMGVVSAETLRTRVEEMSKPMLVSVMLANNETGVVQDVAALVESVKGKDVIFHTDAVQAAGKIPVDFSALGVQMMTLSSHKLYGPKGVGVLIIDRSLDLQPELVGGGQEKGMRSGTENVAAIVGFGRAAELAAAELQQRHEYLLGLRQSLEQRLTLVEGIEIFAKQAERLPNTVFLAIPGIDGEALLMEMDRADIAVSSGSACDSSKTAPSHTLTAMGVEEQLARCAVRVSFGMQNTEADIERFFTVIKKQVDMLRSSAVLAWA